MPGTAAFTERTPHDPDYIEALHFGSTPLDSDSPVQAVADAGTQGPAQPLPHLETIQAAFGQHDISGTQAYLGGPAFDACEAVGAQAFATGDRVAFKQPPDLHTAAHEAAHVVQQRAGVQLRGGMGRPGDQYEQHADAVADLVVAGKSAEALLGQHAGQRNANGSPSTGRLQAKVSTDVIQFFGAKEHSDMGSDGSSNQTYHWLSDGKTKSTGPYDFWMTHGDTSCYPVTCLTREKKMIREMKFRTRCSA